MNIGDIFEVYIRHKKMEDLQSHTVIKGFWGDPKRAESIQRKIGLSKKWLDDYADIAREVDDLEGLYEFQKEDLATEADVVGQYNKALAVLEEAE